MTPTQRKAIEGILDYFNSGNALPVEKATIRGDSPEVQALRAALAEPAVEHVQTLIAKLQADPDYAWSWHCNIAMAYVDAGGDPYTGNQGAARFMKMFANVDPAHELPAPPPADVPLLTKTEIVKCACSPNGNEWLLFFARAVEQLVRQKAGLK